MISSPKSRWQKTPGLPIAIHGGFWNQWLAFRKSHTSPDVGSPVSDLYLKTVKTDTSPTLSRLDCSIPAAAMRT